MYMYTSANNYVRWTDDSRPKESGWGYFIFYVLDSSTTSFNANNNKYYKARHGIFDMSLIGPGLYIGLLIVFENDH